MSAFRRKGTAATHVQLGGCRSWPAGSFITSSGVPSLDSILRGGVGLGTVSLVESDAFDVYSRVLQQCFISQGILQDQKTLVIAPDSIAPAELFVSTLPAGGTLSAPAQPAGTAASQLHVAWQYAKYIDKTDASIGPSNSAVKSTLDGPKQPFCRSVDLNRHLPGAKSLAGLHVVAPSLSDPSVAAREALHAVEAAIDALSPSDVLRVVVCELGSAAWGGLPSGSKWCLKWLAELKGLLSGKNCACMVSIPPNIHPHAIRSHMRHCADYVLELMAFADASFSGRNPARISPDEFKDKHGLLYLRKLASPFSLCPHSLPSTNIYAFKRDRRKLAFSKLHLPPDESAGKGAVSTVASDQSAAKKHAQDIRLRDRRGEILSATTLVEEEEEDDEEEHEEEGMQSAGGAAATPGALCAPSTAQALDF